MLSLPEFVPYLNLTSFIAKFSGVILLKKLNDFSITDYVFLSLGLLFGLNSISLTCIFIYFLATQSYTILKVVIYVPLIVYSIEGLAKYYFLITKRKRYLELIIKLKALYRPPHCEHEKLLVDEQAASLSRIMKFQVLYVVQHVLFTYTPIVINTFNYWFFDQWKPLRVIDIWYPFDVEQHWLLILIIECNAMRFAAFNAVLPDCLMMMMLLQMNYLFECSGHRIVTIIRKTEMTKDEKLHLIKTVKTMTDPKKNMTRIDLLKDFVETHSKLIA